MIARLDRRGFAPVSGHSGATETPLTTPTSEIIGKLLKASISDLINKVQNMQMSHENEPEL